MNVFLYILAFITLIVACLGMCAWLVRWLLVAPESEDDVLSFDPLQRMPPSRGPWVWNYLRARFIGAPRLTYRRDRRGRFRKRDR